MKTDDEFLNSRSWRWIVTPLLGAVVSVSVLAGLANAATVTNCTDANPIVVTTQFNHLYQSDYLVTITGAVGNTACNVIDNVINVLSPTTFELTSVTGDGTWTSGGATEVVITNALAKSTDNEFVRRLADLFEKLYNGCESLDNRWTSGGASAVIPNENSFMDDGALEPVLGGSQNPADGRTAIWGADIWLFKTSCEQYADFHDGTAVSAAAGRADVLAKPAVNTVPPTP